MMFLGNDMLYTEFSPPLNQIDSQLCKSYNLSNKIIWPGEHVLSLYNHLLIDQVGTTF